MKANRNPRFVVGIASSAGGVEPLLALLNKAYCNANMSFILVPHLGRDHETALPELVARISSLEVKTIRHEMPIEHCKIYVLPPNHYAEVAGESLRLLPRPPAGPNHSADVLFLSLAKNFGPNSIGVVLSGADVGADGAAGVRAIRKAGGHTYAQDPATAEFPGMPGQAIATGCIQSVMTAEEIGTELTLVNWAT